MTASVVVVVVMVEAALVELAPSVPALVVASALVDAPALVEVIGAPGLRQAATAASPAIPLTSAVAAGRRGCP